MLNYLLHSKTKRYKILVENTLEYIEYISRFHSNIGISFSGGKDSTVMLYLFYLASIKYDNIKIIPTFFDCNAVWPDTYNQIKNLEKIINIPIKIIKSRYTYQQLRLAEYMSGCFKHFSDSYTIKKIVFDNAIKAKEKYQLDLQCIATRKDESKRRNLFFTYFDDYRYAKNTAIQSFYPMKNWKIIDIWAFIYQYEIPINNLYFKFMKVLGGNIEDYRVDEYLEREALENGSLRVLQFYYPEIFHKEIIKNKNLLNYL